MMKVPTRMKVSLLLLIASLFGPAPAAFAQPEGAAERVEVRKIWDKAPHNAFTDLIRFKDRWICVFREGQDHVSPDGRLRVIESADGDDWTSAALIEVQGADLRDAKISITPAGQLMLSGAAARPHPAGGMGHRSMAWFSDDGRTWDAGREVGDEDFWLWRVTWHQGTAYAIGYATRGPEIVRLYTSKDGKTFDTLVPTLFDEGSPNEHALVFLEDGTCYCLLRRDGQPSAGLLGRAKPPYKQWTWKDLGQKIGGPAMIRLENGRLVAGVRLYDGRVRTGLGWIDPEKGTLTEFLTLPSAGDTSYPGLVEHEGRLWVSYYSSHEGKTSVYLAKVNVEAKQR